MIRVVQAERLFDGERFRENMAVVIEDGIIVDLLPASDSLLLADMQVCKGLLAPGFIDVQVNGGGGVLFNNLRTVEGIAAIGRAHQRYGTTGFMVTFITDTPAHMAEAMAAVRMALEQAVPGLLGVHLEGPFLNRLRKGIHDEGCIRPMEGSDEAAIIKLAHDVPAYARIMLTLAPETVTEASIQRLAAEGIRICAGHTAADSATVEAARQHGLSGFTHLFNAMPPLAGRDPGPVGAAMVDPESYCGIIVDLHHVSPLALKAAIAAHGSERMMLVTDAMPTVGVDENSFVLGGRTITREQGRLTSADGTLAGSDLDMASAVSNTVRHLGLPLAEALRMASLYPAMFLGLDDKLGRIAPGFRASMALLAGDVATGSFRVTDLWIDGVPMTMQAD